MACRLQCNHNFNQSVCSFLRTLTTWHCPHSPAAAAAIIALLSTGRKAANAPHAAAAGEWNRQTDGRTDTVPLHRPCSAQYAGNANEDSQTVPTTDYFLHFKDEQSKMSLTEKTVVNESKHTAN